MAPDAGWKPTPTQSGVGKSFRGGRTGGREVSAITVPVLHEPQGVSLPQDPDNLALPV